MSKVITFVSEIRTELSKVTWPTRNEVVKLTLTVIIISAIVGVYVGGIDFGLTKLLSLVVSR